MCDGSGRGWGVGLTLYSTTSKSQTLKRLCENDGPRLEPFREQQVKWMRSEGRAAKIGERSRSGRNQGAAAEVDMIRELLLK